MGEDFPRKRHITIGVFSYIIRLPPTLYGSRSINESPLTAFRLHEIHRLIPLLFFNLWPSCSSHEIFPVVSQSLLPWHVLDCRPILNLLECVECHRNRTRYAQKHQHS